MKDAISYIRVSSEEQADSGLGLEAQCQRIAAYCAMSLTSNVVSQVVLLWYFFAFAASAIAVSPRPRPHFDDHELVLVSAP